MTNVIDIYEEENATNAVICALGALKSQCKNIIKFHGKRFNFYREGTHMGIFYPSNNASGEKQVVFPILNAKDLTIDGGGATFLFHDRIFPFIIQNSIGITLKNFTVDFSFPRYALATVKENGDKLVLDIDKKRLPYFTDCGNIVFIAGRDELSTKSKKLFMKCLNRSGVCPCYLFTKESSDTREKLAAPFIECTAEESVAGLIINYEEGSYRPDFVTGDLILISNDEDRTNDVIFAEWSKDINVSNVTLLSGAGMGFIAQVCENITLDGFNVYPSGDSPLSITADSVHAVNCSGKLTLKNSTIEKSIDDAVNIHGVYTVVTEKQGDEITVSLMHKEQSGLVPYSAGDVIRISDKKTMREYMSVEIKEVLVSSDRSRISLRLDSDDAERISVGDIVENPDRMPEILIENNRILNCPRVCLSSSKRTVIRSNLLNLKTTGLFFNDAFDYWYESGAVGRVDIVDNVFEGKPMAYYIRSDSERVTESDKLHGRINIVGNTFALPRESCFKLEKVNTVIENDNVFIEK